MSECGNGHGLASEIAEVGDAIGHPSLISSGTELHCLRRGSTKLVRTNTSHRASGRCADTGPPVCRLTSTVTGGGQAGKASKPQPGSVWPSSPADSTCSSARSSRKTDLVRPTRPAHGPAAAAAEGGLVDVPNSRIRSTEGSGLRHCGRDRARVNVHGPTAVVLLHRPRSGPRCSSGGTPPRRAR